MVQLDSAPVPSEGINLIGNPLECAQLASYRARAGDISILAEDENCTPDEDLDGVLDGNDAFPRDPAASVDTDNDGAPDAWNEGATPEQIAASDLILDTFPGNPNESVDADQDGVGANTDADDNDPESDSDNDGLSDSAERDYGSDPMLSDTDGDGFTDGDEVDAGTSPTDINDIPMVDEEEEIRGFPLWLIEVLKARESASAP